MAPHATSGKGRVAKTATARGESLVHGEKARSRRALFEPGRAFRKRALCERRDFRMHTLAPCAGGRGAAISCVANCADPNQRLVPGGGGVGKKGQPAYTFRITATAKRDIRERLGKVFAYSHQTMFPDYPGFAEYGMPLLRTSPP